MKIIYNDATEIAVQQVEPYGDYLRILVIGTTPEHLKELFTDSSRTSRMIVQERGQTIATYEGYTAFLPDRDLYRKNLWHSNVQAGEDSGSAVVNDTGCRFSCSDTGTESDG